MKKFSWLVEIGLEFLGLGLMLYMAGRTLDFVSITMPPEKQFWGYLFLLSTGIGSLIWASVYLAIAKGHKQRGISFAMGILDLLGELGLVYADTQYIASESGKISRMTQQDLSTFILLSIGMIGINVVAYYFFKLLDPEVESEQHAQDLVDQITGAALKSLKTPVEYQRMISQYSPILEHAIMSRVSSQITDVVGHYSASVPVSSLSAPAPVSPPAHPFQYQAVSDVSPSLSEVSAKESPFQPIE